MSSRVFTVALAIILLLAQAPGARAEEPATPTLQPDPNGGPGVVLVVPADGAQRERPTSRRRRWLWASVSTASVVAVALVSVGTVAWLNDRDIDSGCAVDGSCGAGRLRTQRRLTRTTDALAGVELVALGTALGLWWTEPEPGAGTAVTLGVRRGELRMWARLFF